MICCEPASPGVFQPGGTAMYKWSGDMDPASDKVDMFALGIMAAGLFTRVPVYFEKLASATSTHQ